ncbi:MAG TPA: PqiC family protein [Acetobacteraceae bacterium]|nr:PqiC family protein [Acetobacteraceae bacterium]
MRRAASLLVALLLAACASAKTDTYTLSAVPPVHVAAGPPVRPPLEVGEVSIPATIDRDEIVIRAPGDRLDVSSNSVWGAPLDQLIRRALSDDLSERLPPGSVLALGDPAPPHGLRIIAVSIDQFSGDTSGRVVLRASWIVSRSGERPTGKPHRERIEIDAGTGIPRAVVPAMSRALGVLADRIAAGVS